MEQRHGGNRNHKIITRNEPDHDGVGFARERFMKLRLSLLGLVFAVVVGTAFAHGNKVYVKGTVEKLGADSVEVKTADGKTVEVKYADTTIFLSRSNNEDKPAKASDLAAGELVVIYATGKGMILAADEMQFSVPAAVKTVPPVPWTPRS